MLTLQFQNAGVTFRNFGWDGDEVQRQTRPPKQPRLLSYYNEFNPTVTFISYGMMESMQGETGLAGFVAAYKLMLDALTQNGAKIVMLSPFKHEFLGGEWPDPSEHNRQLKLYVDASARLAAERGYRFINLFELLPESATPRTVNGVHLISRGYVDAAKAVEKGLGLAGKPWMKELETPGAKNPINALRERIVLKNLQFSNRYKVQNSEYVFGSRTGNQKGLAEELSGFDTLVAAEEASIAGLRKLDGETIPPPDLHEPAQPNTGTALSPAGEFATFRVADGFDVNLWASEPMIGKPLQMNWDTRGRLWVCCTNLYPQIMPGEIANDKIMILEDTAGSGHADKATVFADHLHFPTGVIPVKDGAYVEANTRIYFMRDTNGDGVADEKEIVLGGFGTEDNHHCTHSFRWSPTGQLFFSQGIFLNSSIETNMGVVQLLDHAGIFEYHPENGRLTTYLANSVPQNPWGHYFERWGHSFHQDSSGLGGSQFILPTAGSSSQALNVPGGEGKMAGGTIISGRHFPDNLQGVYVTNLYNENRTVLFSMSDDGSGYAQKMLMPLLVSTDRDFRPVEASMGPDGALYILDWYNPLIGHMHHHLHDPQRDKTHGRIWRVTAKGRPLVPRPKLLGVPIQEVLDHLKDPEDYTRFQARRALFDLGVEKVLPELNAWVAALDKNAADYDDHCIEALWVYATLNTPEPELLKATLRAKDPNARAAATAVLRRWIPKLKNPAEFLAPQIEDDSARVRLEAIVALSYLETPRAEELLDKALEKPTDRYIDAAIEQTRRVLGMGGK